MRDIASPLDGFASPFGPVRRSLRAMLFGQNEPGFTFEPWDITTLYQDRAGTTPVTAAGQSVGYRRDKSGRGNHEVAINDAARGIYGWMPKTGRRNLLNATDTLATQSVTVTAAAHTLAFTGTGTVVLSGAHVGTLIGTGASDRVTLTFTPLAASLTLTVTGSVTLAQLELGSTDTAYQRVVSNYDVTEAGVPSCYYVLANGVNTAYVTPTITPGTDKVQAFAGVRKNSDAAAGTVIELSDTADSNNGTLFLRAPQAAAANYIFRSRGTVVSNVISPSSYAAPITNVVTGLGDIAGDVSRIRVNGSQVAESLTDQGTGNYLAYPAYIYARGGTTLPFNGYDFGHVVRFGPNLDAATIARVEALIARNTPEVTL